MENPKLLRVIIYVLVVMLLLQLALLCVVLRPEGFFLWAILAVIAIICLYLAAISLGLIRMLLKK